MRRGEAGGAGYRQELQRVVELLRRPEGAREARAVLERLQRLAPNDPDVLQLMGLAMRRLGDDAAALDWYRRSLERHPRQPHVFFNLGNTLDALGRHAEAAEAYREAWRLQPSDHRAALAFADSLLAAGRYEEAHETFTQLTARHPKTVAVWIGLARALRRMERHAEAAEALERALALDPDSFPAHYYRGALLRDTGRAGEAVEVFAHCLSIEERRPEVWYNYANALVEAGRPEDAIEAYRHAIRLRPFYRDAHDSLNRLLWQLERGDEFLESYRVTIAGSRAKADPAFHLEYAHKLMLAGRHDEARKVLDAALAQHPGIAALHAERGRVEDEAGCHDEAREWHERAIALDPRPLAYHLQLAWSLLAARRADEAEHVLMREYRRGFEDQNLHGLLGLAWRLLEDPREHELFDYERFVRRFEIPLPEGYRDLDHFNRELAEHLTRLHRTQAHPIDQTLRGGTQTAGALFKRSDPIIQAVRGSIEACIARHVAALPDIAGHPLCSRKSDRFRFSGSWSVRLKDRGFHVSHVHPAGWISSAYYVQLPECVRPDDPDRQGWIEFGQPEPPMPRLAQAPRAECPSVGTLVLFPSYMWHGTRPFHDDRTRMTIAFDVLPA